MLKRKHGSSFIFLCVLLVTLILGMKGQEVYADTNGFIDDIMDLTGILADTDKTPVINNKYATREEFAQLLLQASPYEKETKSTNSLKLFKDVSKKSSKASYIQLAVTKGYMSGYLNGTFQPRKAVTLKEAVYGTLTLLGFSKADFTGNLSAARYDKFKELGLSKKLNLNESSKLSAKACEILFYNLLNAKQKSGDIYGKMLGYPFTDDGAIDYSSMLDKKTKGPVIATKGWEKALAGKLSSYTIKKDGVTIAASDISESSVVYYSDQAKKIWVYSDKVYGKLENITVTQGKPQDCTISGTTYTIEKPIAMQKTVKAAGIQKGMLVALLLGKDDKVSMIYPIKSTLDDGSWQKKLSFSVSDGIVYKNDTSASSADITSYDVIYYCSELKTIWAFDKKVYGTLESIISEQSEPQELTVSGTGYPVENSKETKKQLNNFSIQAGMPVVLLFGWEDKVTNVLPITGMVAESNWQSQLSFDLSQGTIYKNGVKIAASDIESMDVIYYSNALKTVWVYDKKVYGKLEEISPYASSPSSLVVAGKTYELKLLPVNIEDNASKTVSDLTENAWGKRLRESGIEAGDNIVMFFGYNGTVADIRKVEKMPVTITGYVLSTENKLVKDENQNSAIKKVIHLVDTQGITRDFICSNSSISAGSIVEVSFQNGEPVITKYGSAAIPSDITAKKFSKDCDIIEINHLNFTKVTASELAETVWNTSNVVYYRLNSDNEITDIILLNVTSGSYQYGILKKFTFPEYEGDSLKLTFDLAGTETTFVTDNLAWNINAGPKAFLLEEDQLKDMLDLKSVRISYISEMQANTGSSVCRIADDVQVYFYKNGVYYKGSLKDVTNFTTDQVNGYVEQLQGPIHMIVVTD